MQGNTHDLIIHLLLLAASTNDATLNAKRKIAQHNAHEKLFDTLDALDSATENCEATWSACCAFYR